MDRAKQQTANKKTVTVPCDECNRPSTVRCTVCTVNLCNACDAKSHATKVMQKHRREPLIPSTAARSLAEQHAERERLEGERKSATAKAAADAAASATKIAALEKLVAEAYQRGTEDSKKQAQELEAQRHAEEAARQAREKEETENKAKLDDELKAAADAEAELAAAEAAEVMPDRHR